MLAASARFGSFLGVQSLAGPSTRQRARAPHRGVTTLALEVDVSAALPTEFRLFVPGWNDTENGRYLFDDEAAASVMAAAAKWGVDLMIDLEHQALDPFAPPEPTARDARGWFRLELRDGELWAVGVTWTEDGARRLTEKRQRYVSPAFSVDPETSRITSIINVAIVAIPATHGTPALVAASARKTNMMQPELVKKALDAVAANDTDAAMEILKGLLAAAASGDPEPEPNEPEPASEPVVETAAEAPPVAEEEKKEKKEEMVAASSRLLRLTGATTLSAALTTVEAWRASHLGAEAASVKLAAERAALELARRRENAVELTRLGAETPHTTGLASGALTSWALLNEPLDAQDARIAALRAARGGSHSSAPQPPRVGAGQGDQEFATPHGPVTLSAKQLAECAAAGAKPEVFAANLAFLNKSKRSKETV